VRGNVDPTEPDTVIAVVIVDREIGELLISARGDMLMNKARM
jgi:hypothetical protein